MMPWLLTVGLLFAQAPAHQPAFEVASVRPAPPRTGEARYVRISTDAGRVSYSNVTLKLLISIAYNMDQNRISGGEEWVDLAPYDVAATIPAGTAKDEIPFMLQALLQERFGLGVRKNVKVLSAYGLVIGKQGHKLKPALAEEAGGGNYILVGRVIGPRLQMGALAQILSSKMDRPVVDRTGLMGPFEVNLQWTPEGVDSPDKLTGPSIYTALREQLGLDLVSEKAPIEFLIVEHANRMPVEN